MALSEDDIAWLERLSKTQLLKTVSSKGVLYEVLEWAITHKDWAVRVTACTNPNLPEGLMLSHYKRFGWLELIILVNKEKPAREILEYIATIAPDVRPHSGSYDWNKELRDIARKKLSLSVWSEEGAGK